VDSSKDDNHNILNEFAAIGDGFSINQAILSAIPDMIFVLNRDHVCLDFLSGPNLKPLRPPHDFVGRNVTEVMPSALAAQTTDHLNQAFATGKPQTYNYQLEEDSGVHDYEARIVLSSEDVAIAIVRDVTDEKRTKQGLHESQERFRRLAEAAFEGVAITENGIILDANAQLMQMLKCEPADIIGKKVADFVTPESVAILQDSYQADDASPYEFVGLRSDGSTFQAEARGKSIPFEGRKVRVAVIRDITQRKLAERALRESEERFRLIFEKGPIGMYLAFPSQSFIRVNNALCEMLGYKEHELVGRTLADVVYSKDLEEGMSVANRAHEDEMESYQIERRFRCKNGDLIWTNLKGAMIKDSAGNVVCGLGIIENITERRQAEQQLKQSRAQLHNLMRHMQSKIEEERKHIAREVHDELGQILTKLKIDLATILKIPVGSDIMLRETAESMNDLLNTAIHQVHQISTNLRPHLLDDLGLVEAIYWMCEELEKSAGIKCKVELQPEEVHFSAELTTTIFRMCQEALTNVIRHSNATRVHVVLVVDNDILRLKIIDNGMGITSEQIEDEKSFGIMGMRERLYDFNGNVAFVSPEAGGTIVDVTIPLSAEKVK